MVVDVEAGGVGGTLSKPTAIVIGAGFGGISAAGRLARAGYNVTCIEKHATPGGRCCEIVEQGHRFDVGPSIILVPSAYREAFSAMGDDLERHLEFIRVDPTYKIHFHDGTCLELTADLQRMEAQLETFERGSFQNFLALLRQGHDNLHQTLAAIAHRNFYSLFEFFSLKNGLLIWKLGVLRKHFSYVSSLFTDSRLRAAFSFQDMYIGVSPFDAPSTFSLLQYTEFCDGVWYCRGGMARIAEALAASAQAAGVRFLYSTDVKRIEVSGSRATGVVLGAGCTKYGDAAAAAPAPAATPAAARDQDGGTVLSADVIVCAADLPWAYRNLLPDAAPACKMGKLKYTSSAIMFYWALDREYSQLETHNMFLAHDFKGSFDDIFDKLQLPDEPSFYIHAPSRCDPSAAPKGQDSLMVLVPCGCLNHTSAAPSDAAAAGGESDPQEEWRAAVQRARKVVLARLKSDKGIDNLDAHLKFERVYTPYDWATRFNLERGSCFGLSHTFLQLGFLRPHNQHATYRNLFFAGCSTHPGSGLPNVLLSARLCVERLLMHSAGYKTQSPLGPLGFAAALSWLVLVLYLAASRFPLSYAGFHCLFTLPAIAVLAYRLRQRVAAEHAAARGSERELLAQVQRAIRDTQVLRVRVLRAGLVLAALALVYTTPWDNYLVASGIWSYPPGRVAVTLGWVPLEEYLFFVIQTALTLLWFLPILERRALEARIAGMAGSSPYPGCPAHAPSAAGAQRKQSQRPSDARLRWVGAGSLAVCALYAWWVVGAGPRSGLYMALIIGWGFPVLAVQFAFGGHVTVREALLVLDGLALPTLFLWLADWLAIEMGIWSINPTFLLGVYVGKLPLEEMSFFLVTNVMVLQGALLFVRLAERMELHSTEEGKKGAQGSSSKSLVSRIWQAALRL